MTRTIPTNHAVVAARSGLPWSPADLAAALESCLPLLVGRLPSGKRWWLLSDSGTRVPAYGASDLERQLIASMPGRPSELLRGAPSYELRLRCSSAKRDVLSARLAVFQRRASQLTMSVSPDDGSGWDGEPTPRARLAGVLAQFARILGIEHGAVLADAARRDDKAVAAPRVGWLTYLSKSLGPLPPIPPPTEVIPVDDLGWILVAQPDPVDPANKAHPSSLAYVRHALGARVLLDGPSFPPPAPEIPVAPPQVEAARPEIVVPLVPSYLRTPPSATPAAPSAPVAAPPALPSAPPLVAKPFSSETADIDLAKLVRGSLPFDPSASPAPAHESPPRSPLSTETTDLDIAKLFRTAVPFSPASSTIESPSQEAAEKAPPKDVRPSSNPATPDFGETEEFSLASLLKSGPAVPFERPSAPPAKTTALPAAGPNLPASPGHGRWIRFNPQTGDPLATPYWEALPSPEKK